MPWRHDDVFVVCRKAEPIRASLWRKSGATLRSNVITTFDFVEVRPHVVREKKVVKDLVIRSSEDLWLRQRSFGGSSGSVLKVVVRQLLRSGSASSETLWSPRSKPLLRWSVYRQRTRSVCHQCSASWKLRKAQGRIVGSSSSSLDWSTDRVSHLSTPFSFGSSAQDPESAYSV